MADVLAGALNSHLELQHYHHTLLIVEHDPMLYEDAEEMVEYLAQAMSQGISGIDNTTIA